MSDSNGDEARTFGIETSPTRGYCLTLNQGQPNGTDRRFSDLAHRAKTRSSAGHGPRRIGGQHRAWPNHNRTPGRTKCSPEILRSRSPPCLREQRSTSTSPSSQRAFSSTIAPCSLSGSRHTNGATGLHDAGEPCRSGRGLRARQLFQRPRLAIATRSHRPARKLALYDVHDHADQQASHGHVAGGRHGRNTPHARAVGYSPCRAKCSRPHGNPDLSVGPTVKVLFSRAFSAQGDGRAQRGSLSLSQDDRRRMACRARCVLIGESRHGHNRSARSSIPRPAHPKI